MPTYFFVRNAAAITLITTTITTTSITKTTTTTAQCPEWGRHLISNQNLYFSIKLKPLLKGVLARIQNPGDFRNKVSNSFLFREG